MGWQDRPYNRDDGGGRAFGGSQIRFAFPPWTPWVRRLIILNLAIFVLDLLTGRRLFHYALAFNVHDATGGLQLWRWVTYQFIHGDAGHVIWNMVGLYFFGPELERRFGPRRFLRFYLTCGAVGSLFFTLIVLLRAAPDSQLLGLPLIGASGAVLGLLAGCAMLFPGMAIFGIIPIRVFAVIFGLLYFLNMLDSQSGSSMSDACHFGGMVAAVAWIYYLRKGSAWVEQKRAEVRQGSWQRKMAMRQALEQEVDRILKKVHDHGMHSLTRQEKKTLQSATDHQRRENDRVRHIDQL